MLLDHKQNLKYYNFIILKRSNKMKKILSVILSALILLSCAAVSASAAENELKVTVANDLHLNLKASTAQKFVKRNTVSEVYAHAASSGQLPEESVEIIKSFLADAAANDSSTVLLPGDLTNVGTREEHEAFIALISEFEAATGKSVFVVPGNHDLFDTSVEEFEALYADFGYGEAIANDPATASYVAELDGDYRLLAIDSTDPGLSPHGVDAELVAWVKAQCEKAQADGKKLVAIMHHNLLEHIVLVSIVHPSAVVNDNTNKLADTLADGGVKYIFTAHTHDHDIAKHTSAAGNVIYDCVTTALNAYPCSYREVTFASDVVIATKHVDSIDTSKLPEGLHPDAMALAEADFLSYAKNCTYTGMQYTFMTYTSPKTLSTIIKTDDAELQAILDPVIEKLCEAVNLPLYAKDAGEDGKSLEAMAANMGTTLPATEYKTLVDLAVILYRAHAEGDENYPAYTNEVILLQRALATVINYALADLTAENYTRVLSFVLDLLGVELSDSVLSSVGGALEKFKGNELMLTTALIPVITKFSVDEAPADNNATLPGYGTQDSGFSLSTIIDFIRGFFKGFIDFFKTIFAMFR